MTEAGDTVVGGHERHDRARANGCHRSGRSRRNRAFLIAGLECPAHFPENASGIRAELKVTLDLRLRQKIAGARDRTIDGDGVHDWPVGADRSATSRLLRQTRDGLRPRVLVGPRVLDGLPVASAQLFAQKPRHLDGVGDDEAAAVGGKEKVAGTGLAAPVDAIRPAASQPGEVGLGRQQNPAEIAFPGQPHETVRFFVKFCHSVFVARGSWLETGS